MGYRDDYTDGGLAEYQQFADRYREGPPSEGYTDREAMEYYRRVAPQLPPQDYQEVARQAFERRSPQERLEFGRYLQGQARREGYAQQFPDFNRDGIDDRLQDPAYLAQVTGRMQQQPGMLDRLLGGTGQAGGNPLGHPLAKVALGGIAAYGLARAAGNSGLLGGRGNPLAEGLGGLLGGDRDRDDDEDRHERRRDRDERWRGDDDRRRYRDHHDDRRRDRDDDDD